MMRMKPWIHGSRIYREKVIMVQDTKHGWRARIELGLVSIDTVNLHHTQDEAEKTLIDTMNQFIQESE